MATQDQNQTEETRRLTLAELRKGRGWSQQKLADMLGVQQPTICEAERTGNGLGLKRWIKISEIFDIDLRNISR